MNNFNTHVALTVKSAIKQKLVELGTYVDDELPDYIMVLVVNRKTKEQMDNDLSLFLGHNTEHFTSWLSVVLEQLNNAAAANSSLLAKPAAPAATPASAVSVADEKPSSDEIKEEPKTLEAKNPEAVKDKKKSKEKKREKREKRKKRKEEKKLKKEAKKKTVADTLEKLNRNTMAAISKAMAVTGGKVSPSGEKANMKETDEQTKEPTPAKSSEKKRKRSPDNSAEEDGEVLSPATKKKMMLDAKTMKFTKTITNEKAKEIVKSDEEKEKASEKAAPKKPKIENFTITTTQEVPSESKELVDKNGFGLKMHAEDEIELQEEIIEEEEILEEEEEDKMVSSSMGKTKTSSVLDRLGPRKTSDVSSDSENDRKKRKRSSRDHSRHSKVTASVAPVQRLEARVRPLSVIERSEHDTSSLDKKSLSSVISRDSEEEEVHQPSLASKVELSGSRRGGGGRIRAANTNLILRAVADAHKSVTTSTKRALSEEEDTPRDDRKKSKVEVFTRGYRERERVSNKNIQKLSITVANDVTEEIEYEEVEVPIPSVQDRLGKKMTPAASQNYMLMEQPQPLEYIEEVEEWEEDIDTVPRDLPVTTRYVTSAPDSTNGAAPVDPVSLSLDQLMQKDPKYATRCSYWPACRTGDKCPYKHPSLPCKMFPACTFGDKCLYIHPNCRFDALCTRTNCAYTHASPRAAPGAAAPPAPASAVVLPPPGKTKLILNSAYAARAPSVPKKCMFGVNCRNPYCKFSHPTKDCRYGESCLTPGCTFNHTTSTGANKLKWVAPSRTAVPTASAVAVPAPKPSDVASAPLGSAVPASASQEPNVIVPSAEQLVETTKSITSTAITTSA